MIYLEDLLNILERNWIVRVFDEFENLLYKGDVWGVLKLHKYKYLRSCPVVDLKKCFHIEITVAYD